ncbi:MAG: hypothetical protein KFH98_12690 [Gemmatimonadetes bacterium]|nr:hypothetical protein [Gemmatimonadota bacterium]
MATLNEYFRSEARDFLTALERSLQRKPGPDAAELHRAVRGLRGTAQMAREQRIFNVVSAFEGVTRSIAGGALTWSDSVASRARETIADLRLLLDPTEDDADLDARARGASARWSDVDPAPAAQPAPTAASDTREFHEFAAREAAGIADVLDRGIADLQANPMNREPITAILRRQRALLGSARLDEVPVVADILRAVEDLTRVIVKLDVGVKQEWLDIYRVARDALQTTIAPLLRDELPQASNSVSRLRHMRAELLERYGGTVETPPPPENPLAPQTMSHPAAPFLAGASAPPAAFAPSSQATPAPPASSVPPVVSSETSSADDATDDELQLGEDAVVDEDGGELQLGEDEVVDEDGGELQLGEDAVVGEDGGELQLGEDAVVGEDGGELQLGEDAVVGEDGGELQLGEDAVVGEDGGELQLGEYAIAGEEGGELQPGEDAIVDEDGGELQPGEYAIVGEDGGELQPGEYANMDGEGPVETAISGGAPVETAISGGDLVHGRPAGAGSDGARAEAFARALELRETIARVAAHDPKAREAVDELFDLIRRALG